VSLLGVIIDRREAEASPEDEKEVEIAPGKKHHQSS